MPSHQKIYTIYTISVVAGSEINLKRLADDPLFPEIFRKKSFALIFPSRVVTIR